MAATAPEPLDSQQLFQARLKANDFVVEYLKQLITLSSGTLVLTVTFFKDVLGLRASAGPLLQVAWIAFALCVVMSVLAIGQTTRNLDVPDTEIGKSGYKRAFLAGSENIISAARAAMFFFALGVLSLAVFAIVNLSPLFGSPKSTRESLLEPSAAIATVKNSVPSEEEIVSIEQVSLQVQPKAAQNVYLGWVLSVVHRKLAQPGTPAGPLKRTDVLVNYHTGKVELPPEWRK